MRVKTRVPVLNYDGQPMKTAEGLPMLMQDLVQFTLNNFTQQEQQANYPPADKKTQMFKISLLMYGGETAELSIPDLALIQERAEVVCGPLLHGRIVQWVDTAEKTKAEAEADAKPDKAATDA